ncbi:MAG: hypothetical protein GKR95_16555 [Gammaproteobacteria bacterium]|nr:hypothetical protein [Gammaproteobacteria bacterium]
MSWNFEKSIELMPCLADSGIKRIINGPMIFSPDLGPLVGPHPDLRNYFCANGVMAGFNQGPGIGRALSEWIIQGEPEIDISCWDVARFGDWADRTYTEKTTRYFYENRSEKVFPYQEFEAGRPIHKPGVYERLKDANAVFGASFGQEHPNWFATDPASARDSLTYRQPNWWKPVIDEGKRIRNEVGLMEFSAMAKFEVTGPGATNWLNRVMANTLPRIGRMALAPMLSHHGRIAGDFSISRFDENRYFVLGADYMQLAFIRYFKMSLPERGVKITNVSDDYAGLHICGPNARTLIGRIAKRQMDNAHFPFMSAAEMALGNIDDVKVMRVSFTGETGYEMYLPKAQQLALFDLLYREGQPLGIGLVGTRSLMQTRLEKSFPAWALELSLDYTAIEADMDRFVKPDKGDFIGRDAFLNSAPPRERFCCFTVDARSLAIWGDEAVFLDGEAVGYITSGGYGPSVEQHIALGYVNYDAYRSGGHYSVEILGQLYDAQLELEPLYDPDGSRMRG